MESVEITDDPVKDKPKGFNVLEYMNSTFSMFRGEKKSVKLRFRNKLVNTVIDRFGKDVTIYVEEDEYFTVMVEVKPNTTFFY